MRFMLLVVVLLSFAAAHGEVIGKEVDYTSDGVTLKGYIAYDDATKDKRPGILVVHEWWGNNDYSHMRADMLAKLGYVALAVDMYGEGKLADHPDDAGKFASEVMKNMPVMKGRFLAGLEALKQNAFVDTTRIGAIGYCFGGGVVLNMVRQGVDLKGVVSFHGSLATDSPARPGMIKAKILVCNGAADKMITPENIKDFKAEMKAAHADMKFINYPNALHAFTNPAATENGKKFKIPIAYNEKADKKSWNDMEGFFKKVFKK